MFGCRRSGETYLFADGGLFGNSWAEDFAEVE